MNELLDALKEIIITTGNASVNENQTLDLLKQLAGKCVFATMIKEVDSNLIIYMNTPALDYFGLAAHFIDRYGISFAKEILHPDFFHLFPVELDFFSDKNNYDTTYEYIYNLKTAKGYSWTYVCSQIAVISLNGNPKYILSIACDVNSILNNDMSTNKYISQIEGFTNLELERYKTLSKRELNILRMISMEMTSEEIAQELFLSKSTVDSHRKSILKKLNIKSALGMAKYFYLFESDK
jgi:DNA-binding CsgD family transcriptional regulator